MEAALADSHTITLFNRGRTNVALYPEVERLHGDRDGDLGVLRDRAWYVLLGGLAASGVLMPVVIARHHDAAAARRASASLAAVLFVEEQFLVWCLARYRPARSPDLADALTLSRGAAAAWLAALCAAGDRTRVGQAGWLGWGALLWGETVSDWLDGPLARRRGGTPMGTELDLEADSWLTLWAALAAVRWGFLPAWSAAAPALRYLLPLIGRRHRRSAESTLYSRWERAVGVAQMVVITVALGPWTDGLVQTPVRHAATPVASASLLCLLMRHRATPNMQKAGAHLKAGANASRRH